MFPIQDHLIHTNNMYPSSKRKARPNPNSRPAMPRPKGPVATDRSITTDGIYGNPRFMNTTAALTGCKGVIIVKSGKQYEGILDCYSPQFDVVMNTVTEVVSNASLMPRVIEKMVFTAPSIVSILFKDVEADYATKETFATDSSISKKANGKIEAKELEPWDDTQEESEDSLLPTGLPDGSGWDPQDMFKTNMDKYGVTSTYDSSLAGYTVPLEKKDTEDYRSKEERASKIACEIESSSGYKQRQELENGDEEDRFSAVVRIPERTAMNDGFSNVSPRYYQANKKKSSNKVFQRPSPPQTNHSVHTANNPNNMSSMKMPMSMPPQQRTSSPAHQQSTRNIQAPHQIRSKPPYYPPHTESDSLQPPPTKPSNDLPSLKSDGNFEKKAVSPVEKGEVPVSKTQTSPQQPIQQQPLQQQPLQQQPMAEKPKLDKPNSLQQKSSKNEEIAGLKKFSNDFDIESSKTDAATNDSVPARNEPKVSEVEDKLTTTVKNSTLNPNAKEFNPSARSFTPNSVTYNRNPQTPTPPSRQQATQSPVIPPAPVHAYNQVLHPMIPGQQTVFTSMAPAVAGQPQQFMVTGQPPVNVSLAAPPYNSIVAATMPQNATRFRKEDRRVVAAATGQPLLAPAAAASIQGAKFVQYQAPQGIVTGGPGAPQPAMVSYHHHPPQMYPALMAPPRMFNHQTMTMVPTSVSGVNFEQHGGPNSHIYCTTSMPGTVPGQQSLVSLHGIVNHSTPPTQSQSTTPAGAGVPSPSPVHHQGNANQSNGVPPQPVVYHPGNQMPPPGSHMQANAPTHSNGHQPTGNPASHIHLPHANAALHTSQQHSLTFHSAPGTGPQHMVLVPQGTATGSQSVIHPSSTRSLQASHMHGPNNPGPGVPANAVISHHGNTIPVLSNQASQQLHYLPQQHSQPTTGFQHSQ